MSAHPASDGIERCWSCGQEFDEGLGVSIDDSETEQICAACWERVAVKDRLWLALAFRRLDAGGLGLIDVLEDTLGRYAAFRGGESQN